MAALQRLAHHRGVAGAVEGEIGAAAPLARDPQPVGGDDIDRAALQADAEAIARITRSMGRPSWVPLVKYTPRRSGVSWAKAEAAHSMVFDNFYAHIGRSSNSLGSMRTPAASPA